MPTDHKQKTFALTIPGSDKEWDVRRLDSFNRKEAKALEEWQNRLNNEESVDDLWGFTEWLFVDESANELIDELTIGEVKDLVERIQKESGVKVGESSASSNS